RLTEAGGEARLFESTALRAIVRQSRGMPRRANILCHSALLFAFGRSEPAVTLKVAQEAIAEMDERRPGLLRRAALRRLPRWTEWSWRRIVGFGAAAAVPLVSSALLFGSPASKDSTVGAAQVAAATPPQAPMAAREPAAPAPAAPAPAAEVAPEDPPPAAAAPPAPVAVAAPAGSSASEPSRNAREDAGDGEHRTVSIPPGASILAVAHQLFGELADKRAFLGEVRRLNP